MAQAARKLHDAPLRPWPGRSLDEIASDPGGECGWLVANGVLPADLVTSTWRAGLRERRTDQAKVGLPHLRWLQETAIAVTSGRSVQFAAVSEPASLAELLDRGEATPGRRVLGARAAGRSGRHDISERMEGNFGSEVTP